MKRVRIRVPGTTANLGPGFDTMGVALALYNEVEVGRAVGRGVIESESLPGPVSGAAREMIVQAGKLFFSRAKKRQFDFDVRLKGQVPVARGLGSSVTVRLGVVAGLNELTGARFGREWLLGLVTELEGHPDNAAPAIFGGFTIAGMVGRAVRCLHFPVSKQVIFVTLIPPFEVSTAKARRLVPDRFSKADTVHNLNRAAFIGAAFASGDYGVLAGLFDDRVHQPYRQKLIPQLPGVIGAGEKAGAVGGWLSGSGSTIVCMTIRDAEAIGRAMGKQLGGSEVKLLRAENRGYRVM